jgi:hypothetical protein
VVISNSPLLMNGLAMARRWRKGIPVTTELDVKTPVVGVEGRSKIVLHDETEL